MPTIAGSVISLQAVPFQCQIRPRPPTTNTSVALEPQTAFGVRAAAAGAAIGDQAPAARSKIESVGRDQEDRRAAAPDAGQALRGQRAVERERERVRPLRAVELVHEEGVVAEDVVGRRGAEAQQSAVADHAPGGAVVAPDARVAVVARSGRAAPRPPPRATMSCRPGESVSAGSVQAVPSKRQATLRLAPLTTPLANTSSFAAPEIAENCTLPSGTAPNPPRRHPGSGRSRAARRCRRRLRTGRRSSCRRSPKGPVPGSAGPRRRSSGRRRTRRAPPAPTAITSRSRVPQMWKGLKIGLSLPKSCMVHALPSYAQTMPRMSMAPET